MCSYANSKGEINQSDFDLCKILILLECKDSLEKKKSMSIICGTSI